MLPLALLALAGARGLDRAALARAADLAPDLAPDAPVSLAAALSLWRALVERFPTEHLGLELAASWRRESLGLLGYLTANAATLGEALDRFVAFQSLVYGEAHLGYSVRGDRLVVCVAHDPALAALRQPVEALLASGHAFFQLLGDARLVARRVRMRHASTLARGPYRAFFGVDVEHGADEDALEYDTAILARPIPHGDPRLGAYLLVAAEAARAELERAQRDARAGLATRVSDALRGRLGAGPVEIGDIARALGLGVRALQRALTGEGTRFRDLVDAERRRAAEWLLAAPDAHVAEVARALGFSETAAFSRAFKRWTRRSPAAYRRALRSAP